MQRMHDQSERRQTEERAFRAVRAALKKERSMRLFGTIVLACALAPSLAWAVTCTGNTNTNLVKNPGFENGVTSTITDWTVRFPSSVDTETQITIQQHRSGKQALEMGTEGGENRVSQHLAGTVAGSVYTVCFWVMPGGPNSTSTAVFKAQWNNDTMMMLSNSVNTPTWSYIAFNVVATGNDTISFETRNDDNFYYLDNVSVQECSACTLPPAVHKRAGSFVRP
jgi:hypothetical protein